jgi:hypothetical protein
MHLFDDLWGAFAVCYAIGYMLWIRPRVEGKPYSHTLNVVFYSSLVVFSTLRFLFEIAAGDLLPF